MAGVSAVQGTKVLVIGAGVAGLSAAHSALEGGADVILLSRAPATRSPSVAFRGWLNAGDDTALHAATALQAGGPSASRAAIQARCEAAGDLVAWLEAAGVPFERVVPSAGSPRALGAGQGIGRQVIHALDARLRRFQEEGRLTRVEYAHLADLVLDAQGRCTGALAIEVHTQAIRPFSARAIVLATGGPGRWVQPSTCALDANGAGLGLAHRLGARLADPDRLAWSTALPGPDKDLALPPLQGALAPRLGAERLDLRGLSKADLKRWGGPFPKLASVYTGLNPSAEVLPVRETVCGSLGGLRIDAAMATDLPGLFAAGEAAWGGFGAKALPGDELLAWIHQGREAGRHAAHAEEGPRSDRESADAIRRLEQRLHALHGAEGGLGSHEASAQLSEAVTRGLAHPDGGVLPSEALAELARRVDTGLHVKDRNPVANAAMLAALDLPACLAWARSALAAAARRLVATDATIQAVWTADGPRIEGDR